MAGPAAAARRREALDRTPPTGRLTVIHRREHGHSPGLLCRPPRPANAGGRLEREEVAPLHVRNAPLVDQPADVAGTHAEVVGDALDVAMWSRPACREARGGTGPAGRRPPNEQPLLRSLRRTSRMVLGAPDTTRSTP